MNPLNMPLHATASGHAPLPGSAFRESHPDADDDLPVETVSRGLWNWYYAKRLVVFNTPAQTAYAHEPAFAAVALVLGPPELVVRDDDQEIDSTIGLLPLQRMEFAIAMHRQHGLVAGRPSGISFLRFFPRGSAPGEKFHAELASAMELLWPTWADDLSPASPLWLTDAPGITSIFRQTALRWQRALDAALDHNAACWSDRGDDTMASGIRATLDAQTQASACNLDNVLAAVSYPDALRLRLALWRAMRAPRALTVSDVNRLGDPTCWPTDARGEGTVQEVAA